MLPGYLAEHEGRPHVEVLGVRFGFAQVGVAMDPDEAKINAIVASFRTMEGRVVEFLVADAQTLYYEKDKLA